MNSAFLEISLVFLLLLATGIFVIKEITFVLFARFHIKEGLDDTLAIEESESGRGSFKMRTIMDGLT
jgi:hypothetical protein